MATNNPYGDDARKGAVRTRSPKTPIDEEDQLTKRSELSDELMEEKKDPGAKPVKGVRRERGSND